MGKAICHRSQAWLNKHPESDNAVVYNGVANILYVEGRKVVNIFAPAEGIAIQKTIAVVSLVDFSRVELVGD
ncbi:MAG: hypothetical protein KKG33_12280 [candidate division Zixibacteria bacterium]|nr:hypothetical protein [candidate division Zixibacteria bacterium]MBU1471552.1 hypothetical protein [candidate division Zixibacteria bacterium]MBU2626327.1 hypothetical protein [candidate division Zixibacteria bacterium]